MLNHEQILDFIRTIYPNKDFISLHEPVFAGNEKKYLLDCIDSTFVSSVGKYVDRFEEMVKSYTGAKYAVAAVNGTAALHMALLLNGVGLNDLVITQPLTFIATCNAISYCGAKPVFIDIDRETLGLSAEKLELWLTENTCIVKNNISDNDLSSFQSKTDYICQHKISKQKISACVPMHTFGHPCEIDRIVEICDRFYIPVIEDSAESIGSYYQGKHTGITGKMGILSFNGNKTITTGGGGMILTNDEFLGKIAKHLTTQAKIPHPWKFEHDHIGYNYRLPNVNAALGCAQMEQIDHYITIKRAIADKYKSFFAGSEYEFITEPPKSQSNYWLNAILCSSENEREQFLQYSNEHKVMTRPCWTLMNKLSMFENAFHSELDVALDIEARLVNIPSGVVL